MSTIAQQPREKLRELVARDGDLLLQDPDRCEGLLKDHCGPHRREISALVGALEERIPNELKGSWQSAMTPEAMRARLVKRLEDNRGLAPDVADWAVDAWSYALGVGLERKSDRLNSQVINGIPVAGMAAGLAGQSVQSPSGINAGANSGEFQSREFVDPNQQFQPQVPPQALQQISQVLPPGTTPKTNGKGLAAVAALLLIAGIGIANKDKFFHTTPADPCAQTSTAGTMTKKEATAPVDPKSDPKAGTPTCPDSTPKQPVAATPRFMLPVGTGLPVTVSDALDSDMAVVGQYVRGTISKPITAVDGKTAIAPGTPVVLQITEVESAGKLTGSAFIHMRLVEMTIEGKKLTAFTDQAEVKGPSKTVSTAKKTGILAGVGCGVGAVFGRKKGCGVGAAAGATGGVVWSAKDKPKPAKLAVGTALHFKLTQQLSVA